MRYFDHDTTAASDDLIMALRLEHGGAAVDCYWAILEQIYREESASVISANQPATKALSVRLQIPFDTLKTYVSTMCDIGLLNVAETHENGDFSVMSERAAENIEIYQKKCETARQNGKKGGSKPRRKATRNQDAKRLGTETLSERQAKKRKEKKGIGSDKQNLIPSASCGADADKSAPNSAQDDSKKPVCPLCSEPVRFDAKSMSWKCGTCGEINAPRFVEAVA